jgi:exonuclease VII large subunit
MMNEITKDEMRERLGNLDQIRDLLFGEKLQRYDNRLSQIEGDISSLRQEMRDCVDQLNHTLSTEIKGSVDAWEKKLKYLSLTTHEETSDIRQQIERTDQKLTITIDALDRSAKTQTSAIREELEKAKDNFQGDVQSLKTQVMEELERRFSNLKEAKVSREDLAEVLFELCMRLKGTEFVPDLKEAAYSKMKADFVLPEQREEVG